MQLNGFIETKKFKVPIDDKHDLYTKRGWIEVPDGHGLMVFNWPKEVSLEILNGYPQMYTDHLERGNYYYKV
jgi:hypothetical protein